MPANVSAEIKSLVGDFQAALTSHLEKRRHDGDTYGYAIMLGEDIEMCDAIAITSQESDVAKIEDESFINDFRYLPDEWQHWHHDAFTEFNSKLAEVYWLFRERCPEDEDRCEYNSAEMGYLSDVYSMYLTAAQTCVNRGVFGDVWYRVIWISDCDRSIISDAFHQLNSGRAIKEAGKYFG